MLLSFPLGSSFDDPRVKAREVKLINLIMRMLAYELEARGISDPLRQYVRLCDVWAELARLNGEPLPQDVRDACASPLFSGLEPPPPKEEP